MNAEQKIALEIALHELTTLHGMGVVDTTAISLTPEMVAHLNMKPAIDALKAAFSSLREVPGPIVPTSQSGYRYTFQRQR